MPHCAAFGCNFQSKGNKVTDVSLHSFPNDEKRRKEWEDACGRVQLPKDPRLCSRHFSPDAFDAFNRSKLLKQLTGAGYKRRLKPDAIPTIFAQDVTKRSFKANNKRAKKQQKEQKVDSQPQSGQQQQQQQPPTPSPPTPTVVVTKVEPPDIKPIKEEIEETPVEIVKDSVNPPCSLPTTDEVNPPCSPPTTDAAETAAQRRPHVDPPVHLAVPCLTDHTYADMPSLKLISATDTQYSAAVLKSMNEQRNHGLFCDVTIIIQDKKFRAHKTILSASSTYFHQLFSVAGQVIELNFIKAEIFEEILNYIYSSKIVRVRSDMLEELISAGQILGVKFIANLASPLSQVKGLPGLSKEPENRSDTSTEMMPIITESFSISAEEFNQTSKPTGNDEDEDCDVMFVSQTSAQSKAASQKVSSAEVIDLDASDTKDVASKKNEESHTKVEPQEENATTTTQTPPVKTPILTFPAPTLPDSSPLRSPDSSSNNPSSPARVSSGSAPTTPARSTSFTPEPPTVYTASQSPENSDIMGVHKKHVATSTQQGDFKLRLLDVSESPTNQVDIPKSAIVAKKTVTLNTATEIDSISSGCKVYANIGENTYDIVPVKEDPGEGGSKANKGKRSLMATPLRPFDKTPVSPKAGPNKKKTKTELEDHYELIMDGKTFYVCIVCKRPYVCLTSLRRHFNTHSWEKKYPCRYCNKVFALAEYRTKHEIHHTGERRYQCLLCNEMFMNYQLLSTHCKQVHNQDPSGRKEKDDGNNNLYRLLPCKTVQMKPNSWAADGQGVPVISEDGSVHHITPIGEDIHSSTQSRMLSWDDIFVEPDAHMTPAAPLPPPPPQPGSNINTPAQSSTEFDFVIPETY